MLGISRNPSAESSSERNQPVKLLKLLSRLFFDISMDEKSKGRIEYAKSRRIFNQPGIVLAYPHVTSNEILALAQAVPNEAFPVYPWVALSFFNYPVLGGLLHYIGAMPVARKKDIEEDDKRKAMLEKLFQSSADHLRNGRRIAILPEGTRHYVGNPYVSPESLKKFMPGFAKLAYMFLNSDQSGIENALYIHMFAMRPSEGRGLKKIDSWLLRNLPGNLGYKIWRYLGIGTHEDVHYELLKISKEGGKYTIQRLEKSGNRYEWKWIGDLPSDENGFVEGLVSNVYEIAKETYKGLKPSSNSQSGN